MQREIKRPVGRPKGSRGRSPNGGYGDQVKVYITTEMRQVVDDICAREATNVSEYLRFLIDRDISARRHSKQLDTP